MLDRNQEVELDDLYQDVILDHFKRPRHRHSDPSCQVCQPGRNPVCGDELNIYLSRLADGKLRVSFDGHGCSISQASASIMTDAINGKSSAEAQELIRAFEGRIRGEISVDPDAEDFADLDALSGVSKFPVRIKCASLAWKALELALAEVEKKQTE